MAEVDRAEALLVVPVERERAQRALQLGGEGEEVGDFGALHGPAGAVGAGGRLQDPHGRLGAQGEVESAALAGQLGQPVEAGGEEPGTGALARCRTGRVGGADRGGEGGEVLGEALALAPPVGLLAAGHQPGQQAAFAAAAQGAVLGGPQRRDAHPADLIRQLDPALGLLVGGAAQREQVELVLRQPAHQSVAPEPGLTGRIRVTTVGEQSDPHEYTPRSPLWAAAVEPATHSGTTLSGYAGGATDGCPSHHRKG